jgi:transposase InsO family protein
VSKARLVITAVVVEGRTRAQAARTYGVSKGWVSKLLARYRLEGEAAFEPRSRRPKTSPRATAPEVVALVVRLRKELSDHGLDAGPRTIGWHLEHHHGIRVSVATIGRQLAAQGLVEPEPKKRPKASYLRFEAEQPNETWQADFTHFRLAGGRDVEVLSWLDDHSRYALRVTAHVRVTGSIVLDAFRDTVARHGTPASTLTDNGMVFTTRLSGGKGGRNGFEHELRRLGVVQKNSRPSRPTTCGKVERFQQTLKNWLRAQPDQPATLEQLQTLLDRFVDHYNHHRPHSSLPQRATPPPSTPPDPRPARATAPATPTTASGATASTPAARSPSDTAAGSTPSASAEPTPEPASSSWSTTSTSGSSTQPPASSSANSNSTPPSATSPPADHPAHPGKTRTPEPTTAGSGGFRCPETSQWCARQCAGSGHRRQVSQDIGDTSLG